MSESQIQIKRNIHLLVEFGASQIMCIYLLIAKSLYASTTVTVKNLPAGLKKIPMENMGATVCTLLTDVLG